MRMALRVVLPIVLMAAAACQSGADDEETARTEETTMQEWALRLESSGGITGRGDGSVSIDSEGQVERTTPNGTVCRGTVDGELLETLTRVLVDARADTWRSQYLLQGGADFFTYTLTMEIDGRPQPVVEWNDGVELPTDLRTLWDAIGAVTRSVDCGQRSATS